MTRETAVATGRRFEALAADYLKVRGCRIAGQNFRCKAGEIDLIVTDAESKLIFVKLDLDRAIALVAQALQSQLTSSADFVMPRNTIYSPTVSSRPTFADLML